MSFGMALIHDMDATKRIYDKSEDENVKPMEGLPGFSRNNEGGIVTISSNNNNHFETNKRNVTFDYKLDEDIEL